MPPAQIANGESGSSVRTKLNKTLIEYVDVVRDFGADPTGGSDSKTAFQNAVTSGYAVYVPNGTYTINSAVDLSLGGSGTPIIITGAGAGEGVPSRTVINANFAGFVFDNNTVSPSQVFINDCVIERLYINNTNIAGGCIRNRNGDSFVVRNCRLQGHFGVFLSGVYPNDTTFSGLVQNCRIMSRDGTAESGGIGVMLGPETAVMDSSIVGFDNNIRVYGAGSCIHGCRIEVGRTGVMIGLDATGAGINTSGLHIAGNTMEGNLVTIQYAVGSEVTISANAITFGSNGPPNGTGSSTTGLLWTGGSGLLMESTVIAGGFTTAGVHATSIGQNANTPEMTLINCTIQGGWVVDAGVNNGLEGCVAVNCSGVPNFAIPIARLLRIPYAEVGSRRMVSDANITTFGQACTTGGGTVATNTGGVGKAVPVFRSSDLDWYVG